MSSTLNYRWILNLNVKSAELLKILERPAVSEFGKFGVISSHVTIQAIKAPSFVAPKILICADTAQAVKLFRDCQQGVERIT